MEEGNIYERPEMRHREKTRRASVRKGVGLLFRDGCDRAGEQPNLLLEDLITQWNVRGRPMEVVDLSERYGAEWRAGRASFKVHRGYAFMVRQPARQQGIRLYKVYEGIMLEWLDRL